MMSVLRGQVVSFDLDGKAHHESQGAIAITADGRIAWTGAATKAESK